MSKLVNPSRQQKVAEILKCGKDPVYFMKTYIKIQHPVLGLIPFETYDFQDDCIKQFQDHRFNIVLKSRQLGLSTITAAYSLWMALFKKDKTILVIATKLTTAINFIKKIKTMLDFLPTWLLLTKYEPTKQAIRFTNGSTITAVPTSPDAGRSEALALLIVDEAAFIRDFDDIWTGLYPALSTGGSAIVLSTPNGVGGQYYKLWTDGESGVNAFNPIRLLWDVHPDHDHDWFNKETKNLPRRKVAQEFLCDFITSGDTFLQPTELDRMREMIRTPMIKEGPQNGVWIWHQPVADRKYVISADVARGDASDFSTFHIFDYETCEIVAEFMGKTPPDKLSDLLFEYGKRYNFALVCPEQNSFGYFTCVKLRDAGYPRLYYSGLRGDPFVQKPASADDLPGFSTQTKSRHQILAKFEELIRNGVVKSYSQRLYDQMQVFVWNGAKAMASKDAHDDLIISAAIGLWLCAGDGSSNDQSLNMAYAILKATSRGSRTIDQAINPQGNRNPMEHQHPQLRSLSPFGNSANHQNPDQNSQDNLDFAWLFK